VSGLPQWRITLYKKRRDQLELMIDELYNTILPALTSGKIKSYEFDSGEGKQKTSYTSVVQLQKLIQLLESNLDRIYNKLACRAVVNLSLRRYPGINRL